MPETQIALTEPNGRELLHRASATPMAMMERMMENPNCDPEKLAKFMELHFQWQREEARLAYVAAIQTFKANPPEIHKSKKVSVPTSKGDMIYYHAELDKMTTTIADALKAVGITASWNVGEIGGRTTVSLILTHSLGHSETVSTIAAPADTSGGKNNVQAIGSTITYLQRYTLLAGLGLAAVGHVDDDGRSSEDGMEAQAVADWLTVIGDCMTGPELQKQWRLAYQAAQAAKDPRASRDFTEAKDARKKELHI